MNLQQIDETLLVLRQRLNEDFDKAVAWAKKMIQGVSKTFGGTFGDQTKDTRLNRLASFIAKRKTSLCRSIYPTNQPTCSPLSSVQPVFARSVPAEPCSSSMMSLTMH